MSNRIQQLFQKKNKNILSVFCTAGFPKINDLETILVELQKNGVDMVEIGMPFSDPTADGPVIQYSNTIAINNGMMLKVLFEQLKNIRDKINIPLVLMGYFNPVYQYGIDKFLQDAHACGIDGIIIPDLPMYEYESMYKSKFEQFGLQNIFLVTPQTSDERIRKIDELTNSFIYIVSSNAITGGNTAIKQSQENYFERVLKMPLKNPTLIGFGIKDKSTFNTACQYANGAIIGTAFINAIDSSNDIKESISNFITSIYL
ncbi:MAG TPA: tryptophan synthase subunit alpha [Chitinophagales bacterium]|jgi:tryptophan synthase alpha chain|nr:tryptophan synthase subunit alpha [Chitinophagales bacterium]MBP6155142.1 tryptophan synthase subunit alpha [Chitinophagales bacterium]HQV79017.1 tryptophan synthase subunit alpha [Chitinophagales bacterium]HQW79941.1 tryptophan synthase subunit alpha [Chitinophagales bacterium]